MHLSHQVILLCTFFSLHPCCAAADPPQQGADIADQLFDTYLGDTETERQLLEDVTVSREDERRLGRQHLGELLASLKRQKIRAVRRGRDVAYLESLVEEIRPQMQNADRYPTIEVLIADSEVTDARSFPGGTIVVSTALVDFSQSEAALVGVLAHELSHIDRGHQLRSLRTMKLAQDTFASGSATFSEFMARGTLVAKQFARPFRPEEESEADLDAAKWMFELGYDPLEMADLFRRLHTRDRNRQLPLPGFLRTHPYHAERYAAVKELAQRMRAAEPGLQLYVGRENLRQRVPRREHVFAE